MLSGRRAALLLLVLAACGGEDDAPAGVWMAPAPLDVPAPGGGGTAAPSPTDAGTAGTIAAPGTGGMQPEPPPPPPSDPSPPVAVLSVTPDTGTVPLMVMLDATASHDEQDAPDALVARFDFDGDGVWDTKFDAARTAQVTYEALGSYDVLVEVRDTDDMTDVADAPATVTVEASDEPYADIAVDASRDGVVDHLDDMHEAVWSAAFGAAFLANFDDDDGDATRDAKDEDIDGPDDMDDLMPVFVRQVNGLAAGQEVRLSVGPAAGADAVRVFFASGEVLHAPGAGTVTIPNDRVSDGDVELRIESSTGRSADWDGEITLELEIYDGADLVSSDSAVMRAAPIILPADTQATEALYVMRIANGGSSPNLAYYDAVVANLPKGIELFTVNESTYGADRWVQDSMQTGYQVVPSVDGVHRVNTYLQTERDTPQAGLESLLPYGLLGTEVGYAYPGGSGTSHNYGGNLEVVPPHEGYPFGRLLVGGGSVGTLQGYARTDRMASAQRDWLEAQGAQVPAVEISTEWLTVGHVDEVVQAIPDGSGSGREWKFVITSPDLAIKALEDLEAAGDGNLVVFEGRSAQTTVSGVLGNTALMSFNALAQARVDSIRMKMIDELGVSADDFIELPVLYEIHWSGPADMAAAYNPGMQNLVRADDVLFVPDPEGPGSAWEDMTRDALEATGHSVVFVDIYASYHVLLGEAHCGTNFRRVPYKTPWWEVEP